MPVVYNYTGGFKHQALSA